jgi:hypothetical protein
VDHTKLRTWLGLPPGQWPPNHYILLGLQPGQCDPATVERLVLARMEKLRAHQLLNPELVTEGMNRLAQALICLTDAGSRTAYDAELGISPPPPPSVGSRLQLVRTQKPARPLLGPSPMVMPVEVKIPGFPLAAEGQASEASRAAQEPQQVEVAELVEVAEKENDSAVPKRRPKPGTAEPKPATPRSKKLDDMTAYPLVVDAQLVAPPPENGIVDAVVVPQPPAAKVVVAEFAAPEKDHWQPASRRELIARIVHVRRMLEVWDQLSLVFDDPTEPIDHPLPALTLLEAAAEGRRVLRASSDLFDRFQRPGSSVAALLLQVHPLGVLRILSPEQREELALDWREGETLLVREQARLRQLMRSGRPTRGRWHRALEKARSIVAVFVRTPESLLACLAAAALVLTWFRSRGWLEGFLFP